MRSGNGGHRKEKTGWNRTRRWASLIVVAGAAIAAAAQAGESAPIEVHPMLKISMRLAGSGNNVAQGVAFGPEGDFYVVGTTTSKDFLVKPRGSAKTGSDKDVFVMKLDPNGAVVYSRLIGGSGDDTGLGIAVDATGNAFITGMTASTNFPMVHPLQATNAGATDLFIAELDATGTNLLFSTYYGGSRQEPVVDWVSGPIGNPIALDPQGNIYVTGSTVSRDFPTTAHALQREQCAWADACSGFVLKVDPAQPAVVYGTYFGTATVMGVPNATGQGIAVDTLGNAYLCGTTYASLYVGNGTSLMPGEQYYDRPGAYLAKLNAAGDRLLDLRFIGGGSQGISNLEAATTIAVDAQGAIYVGGYTSTQAFPVLNADQAVFASGSFMPPFAPSDVFVTKIAPGGSNAVYSTFLGGYANSYREATDYGDAAYGIAFDATGNAVVSGAAGSANFPCRNALPESSTPCIGSFVALYNPEGKRLFSTTWSSGMHTAALGVAVDRNRNLVVVGDGYVLKMWYPTNLAVQITRPTQGASQSVETPVTIEAETVAPPSEQISRVDFYAGKCLIGSCTNAPYRVTWTNPIPGAYQLAAKSHTPKGATGVSAAVDVVLTHPSAPSVYYTFSQLKSESTGYNTVALNNRAQVVGTVTHSGHFGYITVFHWDALGVQEYMSGVFANYRGTSINDLGQILGYSYSIGWGGEFDYGFLLTAQGRSDLCPGQVHNLNNRGQVVGGMPKGGSYVWDVRPIYEGFIWETGKVTHLGTLPNESESVAYSINNLNQVVGNSGSRAFLWADDVMADLNALIPTNSGWQLTTAVDVNDAGQVLGAGYRRGVAGGYVWQEGTVTDLEAGRGGVYQATAINADGQVVGSTTNNQAVLWQGGHWINLNAFLPTDKDWTLSSAQDINDHGQILCWGRTDGLDTSFVLTPHQALNFQPQECTRQADGQFKLSFEGLPYAACVLEVSTDLKEWTGLKRVEPTAGAAVYLDLEAARSSAAGQRFYRLRPAR